MTPFRSHLYRYCGNDWANNTDPDGLDVRSSKTYETRVADNSQNESYTSDGNSNSLAIQRVTTIRFRGPEAKSAEPAGSAQDRAGVQATKKAVEAMGKGDIPYSVGAVQNNKTGEVRYTTPQPGVKSGGRWIESLTVKYNPKTESLIAIGHTHLKNDPDFSKYDVRAANDYHKADHPKNGLQPVPIYKNKDQRTQSFEKYSPSNSLSERQKLQGATVSTLTSEGIIGTTVPSPY